MELVYLRGINEKANESDERFGFSIFRWIDAAKSIGMKNSER